MRTPAVHAEGHSFNVAVERRHDKGHRGVTAMTQEACFRLHHEGRLEVMLLPTKARRRPTILAWCGARKAESARCRRVSDATLVGTDSTEVSAR